MEKSPLSGLSLLLLDDDGLLRRRLSAYLSGLGAEVSEAKNIGEARNLLGSLNFDLGLLDVNLPDGLGLEILEEKLFSEDAAVVIMTAEGGIDGAVKAIRLGAVDYLVKPFEPEEVPLVFQRGRQKLKDGRIRQFEQKSEKPEGLQFGSGLSGIKEMVSRIIESDTHLETHLSPVLIEGETGTGKTSLARWIHSQGPRKNAQLVQINAATLPEKLAEAELFGYEKGAFTDAKTARMGLFEAASGGTLFIDELASLPASIQAKILTAIEDHKIRRVGGTREIEVDARIIAATNISLDEAVANGEFREDLRHRLDLFRIRIPPLRERSGDIVELAGNLLPDLAARHRKPHLRISASGYERLKAYSWPGNVRELIHELERAIVFENGEQLAFPGLTGSGTPMGIVNAGVAGGEQADSGSCSPAAPTHWTEEDFVIPSNGFSIEEAINALIEKALHQTNNNVSAAARLLGVNRDYIRYRTDKKKKI